MNSPSLTPLKKQNNKFIFVITSSYNKVYDNGGSNVYFG